VPALLSSLVDARRDELSAVLSADGRCRPCLRGWLARVPDPRSPLGRWHSLEFVFGLAVCAFTSAGHDSPSTIADWAAGRCQETLAVLGGRRDPWTGKVRPPCERAPSAGSSPGSARRPRLPLLPVRQYPCLPVNPRIRPSSPSRVRRPPPRRGACTATASPPSVRHRLHTGLGSARRRLVGRGAGSLTARGEADG